ncbi:MAG: hypothetical protein O2963_00065 [Proteobacteria bacterium]|nr:hypothetical protein [Pseudomonadota bacterium]
MIMGIDPGKSGGIAVLELDGGTTVMVTKVSLLTTRDLHDVLKSNRISMCYLEKVASMPRDGSKSAFSFGRNLGTYEGLLTALQIPFEYVLPRKWQTEMSCLTGGDKNVTKSKAQQLFPAIKITHAIADALLIAEWGRRQSLRGVGRIV